MQLHLKTLYTLTVIFYVSPKLTTKRYSYRSYTYTHKKPIKELIYVKYQKKSTKYDMEGNKGGRQIKEQKRLIENKE